MTFPLNHAALHDVDGGNETSRITLECFMQGALNEAVSVVVARLAALDFKHATTSTYSPVHSDSNSLSGKFGSISVSLHGP